MYGKLTDRILASALLFTSIVGLVLDVKKRHQDIWFFLIGLVTFLVLYAYMRWQYPRSRFSKNFFKEFK